MFVEPHCCYGAQADLCPSLPIDEDHPGGRVTTRSLSKEPAGAHGAMLTLLGMERDSRRSVSTCNYLCKINTVCCNVAHVHGLNCRCKSHRAVPRPPHVPLFLPAASHSLTFVAEQNSRCCCWGATVGCPVLAPLIPQLPPPQCCKSPCSRAALTAGAASLGRLQAAASRSRARTLARPGGSCQLLGSSWLLSYSGRAAVSW